MVVLAFLCMVSIVLRYRRAAGVERKQINWLLYAVSLFATFYAIYIPFQAWGPGFWGLFLDLFFMAIPLAIGIAVLRYRLYDIDLIIRRTLQYTLLTGLLALVYFGSVVVLQNVIESLTGEQSPVVIVFSTLTIAGLFNPLRTGSRASSTAAFSVKSTTPSRPWPASLWSPGMRSTWTILPMPF